MQLRQILAAQQKQNKYVTLQRHVARLLIQLLVTCESEMACDGCQCDKDCKKLVIRSNSETCIELCNRKGVL